VVTNADLRPQEDSNYKGHRREVASRTSARPLCGSGQGGAAAAPRIPFAPASTGRWAADVRLIAHAWLVRASSSLTGALSAP